MRYLGASGHQGTLLPCASALAGNGKIRWFSGQLNSYIGMAVSFFVIQRQAAMAQPAQSNFDRAQAASAAQFDRQSSRYGKSHILADTRDVTETLGDIAPAKGARALDAATGGGHTALCLARMVMEYHGGRRLGEDA